MTEAASSSARRFLLVHDNPRFGDYVASIAIDEGYQVEVTTNAADFKAAYLAVNPNLLGLDMIMPDADGLELLSWLFDIGSEVPVLVFSSKQAVYLKAAKAMADSHGLFTVETFGKPLDVEALKAALQYFRGLLPNPFANPLRD